jgi:hypothetical protein
LFIEIHWVSNRSIFRKVRNFCFSLVRIVYCTTVFQGRRTKAFGGFVPTQKKIARYLHIHKCPAGFVHQHARIAQRVVHWIIDKNVLVIYAIKVCVKKNMISFFFTSQIFWSNGLFVINLLRERRYIMYTLARNDTIIIIIKKNKPNKKCIHIVTYLLCYILYYIVLHRNTIPILTYSILYNVHIFFTK